MMLKKNSLPHLFIFCLISHRTQPQRCHSCIVKTNARYPPLLSNMPLDFELKTINQLSAQPLPHALFRKSAHLHAVSPPEAPFASIRNSVNARLLLRTRDSQTASGAVVCVQMSKKGLLIFLSANRVQKCSCRSSPALHRSVEILFVCSPAVSLGPGGQTAEAGDDPMICVTGDI